MRQSVFHIAKMDCAAEENLIRLRLDEMDQIANLEFDLDQRQLTILHEGETKELSSVISDLDLGEKLISSMEYTGSLPDDQEQQRKLLWAVLAINATFFVVEMVTGLLSGSMGLVADSLDMLADAFVYGLSLMAVGASLNRKKQTATLAGYFQLGLAVLGMAEVIRRFLSNVTLPDFQSMIIVSVLALAANALSLYLLRRSRNRGEVHMKASMIFTANDVIINLGVITAAATVWVFKSGLPDLIIGSIVFGLVIRGALRILSLGKN